MYFVNQKSLKSFALLFVGLWALVNTSAAVWAFASSPRTAFQAILWATLLNPTAHQE